MSLDLRRATPGDAERVAKLARDTFVAAFAEHNRPEDLSAYIDEAFSLDAIRAEIEDPASTYLWAEETGIPAGYAKLRRGTVADCVTGERPVELQRIYAQPDRIGAGVGKSLLHMVIKIARAEGYKTLWLGVWEHNERAITFYRHQGFEHIGEHLFMLGNDRQTDRILQLNLRA